MSRRLTISIILSAVIIFGIWYFIAPLYKYAPPQTAVATVLKPSTPLDTQFLRGHWTMVFFGYMHCPKICPRTLGLVRDAWNMYPNNKAPAKFVFANLTDTNNSDLQEFLQNYHADFRGITNDDPDMQYLYEKLNIFAEEQGTEINHTAALMLIDPRGRLRAVFTPPFTATQLVADLNVITNVK